jgi:hypothetical protein
MSWNRSGSRRNAISFARPPIAPRAMPRIVGGGGAAIGGGDAAGKSLDDAIDRLSSNPRPIAPLFVALRRQTPCAFARQAFSAISISPRALSVALTALGLVGGDSGDSHVEPASVVACGGRAAVADWRHAALPTALLAARDAFARSASALRLVDVSSSPTLTREGLVGLVECAPTLTALRVTGVPSLATSPLPWSEVAAVRARSGAPPLSLLVVDAATLAPPGASPAAALAALHDLVGGAHPLANAVALP